MVKTLMASRLKPYQPALPPKADGFAESAVLTKYTISNAQAGRPALCSREA